MFLQTRRLLFGQTPLLCECLRKISFATVQHVLFFLCLVLFFEHHPQPHESLVFVTYSRCTLPRPFSSRKQDGWSWLQEAFGSLHPMCPSSTCCCCWPSWLIASFLAVLFGASPLVATAQSSQQAAELPSSSLCRAFLPFQVTPISLYPSQLPSRVIISS